MAVHEPTVLLTGARVFTADPSAPWAQAAVVRRNHIVYVGAEELARERAGAEAEEIRIADGLIVPGLNDSHTHLTWAAHALTLLNLEDVSSVAELQAKLREYARIHSNRRSIEGYGLAYEALAAVEDPERTVLDDAVSDRPVIVRAFDYHTAWCNSEAIRRAGIARGADLPLPNEIVVDRHGNATGMLKERLAYDAVASLADMPDPGERDRLLVRAMRYLNRLGITSVQNMDGDLERLDQYEQLRERDEISVRAYHYMSVYEDTPREMLREFASAIGRHCTPWNRLGGIRLFIDGAIETGTALIDTLYAQGSGGTGMPSMDFDTYRDLVLRADALGLDVATHAVGDRASEVALDAYALALETNGGDRGRRHRIEHLQVVHPQNLARFRPLGVVASMQPLRAVLASHPRGSLWMKMLGPDREARAFMWQSLREEGAPLAFGSDWPVASPDIRLGLCAALTRADAAGNPPGGWQPQESLTLAQALLAYTRGAAYAEGEEGRKGILAEGALADMTVFARDLFTVPPSQIPEVDVVLTMVDGHIVHRTV